MAVGSGVTVGVEVAGIIVTIGDGKVAGGDKNGEEHDVRKIKSNRVRRCFMQGLYQILFSNYRP